MISRGLQRMWLEAFQLSPPLRLSAEAEPVTEAVAEVVKLSPARPAEPVVEVGRS
jgi:hypothetical protein